LEFGIYLILNVQYSLSDFKKEDLAVDNMCGSLAGCWQWEWGHHSIIHSAFWL